MGSFQKKETRLSDSLTRVISILGRGKIGLKWINIIGLAVLFLLVFITFVDVACRYFFNSPITGRLEITEVLLVCVVYLGIALTHANKGHVAIDLIVERLSPRARIILEIVTNLIGLCVFAILTWEIIIYIEGLIMMEQDIDVFELPLAPFATVIPIGCSLLILVIVRDILKNIVDGIQLNFRFHHWVLAFGITACIVLLAICWMKPELWDLSLPAVGIIGSVTCLVFFLCGMPISFVMMAIGFVFIAHIRGMDSGFAIIGIDMYQTSADNVWAAVAYFTLMGFFCLHTGMGTDLYNAAYKWMGSLFGGVAIATVGACAAFAAIVGDMIASTVTFSAVSLPEMRKYKYSESLSTGTITAGATLGPLIPPSITFIMYGVLSGESIGKLFLGGVFPGLLLAFLFMSLIFIRCKINPELGPQGPSSTVNEKLVSMKAAGPIALLFILVIGGIYAGIFTPTEGGGIGAFGMFIFGLILRRFTWKNFVRSLYDSGQVISMVFLIVTGGTMFTRFLVACNLNTILGDFFQSLALPSLLIVVLILIVFFFFGCIIENLPLMLIGVPLFHPIVVSLGVDPIWFAVLLAMVMNLGMITPPVGAILFAIKGVEKDIPISVIYRGVLPFIAVSILAMVIIILFPPIATWLPYLIK